MLIVRAISCYKTGSLSNARAGLTKIQQNHRDSVLLIFEQMPSNFRMFSYLHLRRMWSGQWVLINFDVTMATNFWQAVFSENRKSLLKMKKNHFSPCDFYVLAHISVPLSVLITSHSILVLSWSFGKILKSNMPDPRWLPFGSHDLINAYVANGGWVPRSQGMVPPTQTQVGRTPHNPALPTTQPRAPPATQPQP